MSGLDIYWLTRLDSLRGLLNGFHILVIISFAVSIGFIIFGYCMCKSNESYNDDSHVDPDWAMGCRMLKFAKPSAIISFCFACILAVAISFIPTTKEMASIIVLPKIVSSENTAKLEDISKDMIDIAASWLKDIKENNNSN